MEKVKRKIYAVCGNNFKDVNLLALTQINPFDFTTQNIIIVPDRSSLVMEKLVFDTLAITSTMNINVMGISRFAKNIFKELQKNYNILSKRESVLLTRCALKNLQGKLQSFNNDFNLGLCEEVYENIAQLKSNEISSEQLSNATNLLISSSSARVSDLKIIMEEYNSLLGDKLDGNKMLELLEQYIQNSNLNFDKVNIFFLNYDALTQQGYSLLKVLARTNAKVYVGAIVPDGDKLQKNKFIFEHDILDKLKDLANQENFEINILRAGCTLNPQSKHINYNLYSLTPTVFQPIQSQLKQNYLRIKECFSREEEIEDIAQKINFLIKTNKCKYKNIAVACSNLEADSLLIEKVFNDYDFSYFVDSSEYLNNTQTIKFLLCVLEMFENNFAQQSIEQFLTSLILGLQNQHISVVLDVINTFNVYGTKFFNIVDYFNQYLKIKETNKLFNLDIFNEIYQKEEIIKNLTNITNNISKLYHIFQNCNDVKSYCDFVKKVIDIFNLFEQNQLIVNSFDNQHEIKLQKIYEQIPDKLLEIFETINNVLPNETIKYEEFLDLFSTIVDEIKISTVPISSNAIFIGDATDSFFENCQYLFVCGANEGSLPRFLNDNGILSDDILNEIKCVASISPTIKMINRRNRFKTLNLLQNAEKGLFVSYSLADGEGKKLLPSSFVVSLKKMFNVQIENSLIDNVLSFEKSKNIKKDKNNLENNLKLCSNNSVSNISKNILKNNGNKEISETSGDFTSNISNSFFDDKTIQKFAIFLGNKNRAKHEFLKTTFQQNYQEAVLYNSLFYAIDKDIKNFDYFNNYNLTCNKENLFFTNKKITVSQIETYLSCPFRNYANYGLKIKEIENFELAPKDIGIILHKITKIFLTPENNYIENINLFLKKNNINLDKNLNTEKEKILDIKINEIVDFILKKISETTEFYKLKIPENKSVVMLLKNEIVRLLKFLYYSQSISLFKPTYLEEYFGSINFPAYEFDIDNKTFKLVGIFDRVDIYKNMFIVIDYKSGGSANGGYSEIFYGNKIQIFIYLKVLSKILGKKPCGAFYFPIKNQYDDKSVKNYMLKGKMIKDNSFIHAMDTSLNFDNPNSKIFGVKVSTAKKNIEKNEIVYNASSTAVDDYVLNNCMNYSFKLLEEVLLEILQGNIIPNPIKDVCDYCSFKGFCGFNKNIVPREFIYENSEIKKEIFENDKINFE